MYIAPRPSCSYISHQIKLNQCLSVDTRTSLTEFYLLTLRDGSSLTSHLCESAFSALQESGSVFKIVIDEP